ncbi:MAG: response regulator [Bacteroidota bacterium]
MDGEIKILLIEDNPADARFIDIFLKTAFGITFELTIEDTLSKGLLFLKKSKVDIIIADLTLPDSSGLSTFIDLHQSEVNTPIIVLTGLEDEKIGLNAVKLGAQDFLIKGKLHPIELKRSINYSIERHKLLNELSESTKKLNEKTEDLLKKQEKLEEAQRLAHIGSWEFNVEEDTISWSDELYRIFGLTPQEINVPYEKFLEMVHPDDREITRNIIDDAFDSNETFDINYRIVRPDGTIRMLHAKNELTIDSKGKIVRVLGTNQDVTDQFHEEELEKLVLAATQSYNSVIIANRDGKIEWVNDGFTKLTGYTVDEVKDTFGEVLRRRESEELQEQKKVYEQIVIEKKPITYECKNYSKEGKEYWIITTVTPVFGKDGEVERIIAIDSDITIRKKIEEELQLANKIAEHSLMKGSRALNELLEAKKQLEESLMIKEQFLANMSHEIRTPMNAIIGFTSLVLKSELTEEIRQFVRAIKTSGENLLVIINDILDFSKLESGKIIFEKIDFDINQLMATLVELMLPKANEKKIKLISSISENIPRCLVGDPTRLNQILINLLSNAIKFTSVGEVRITITTIKEDDINVELEFKVCDTGIGIPEESQSKIFLSFTQGANDTSRKFGGTGLGLTICKQLIEGQGGHISVSSKVNQGSCFSFRLNFQKSEKENIAEIDADIENDNNVSLEGIKVLLVEDNLLNQILAKKVLTNWKCNITIADNGLIAISKLEKEDFDLILMDIQMPEMNGYETTTHVRKKLPAYKNTIPIIAMTAHAFAGEVEKCKSLGMNDYISKPFDERELHLKIKNVLNITKHP